MASYRELFRLHSDTIRKRAREQEISGRGSMSKVEQIAALADEDLSGHVEILDQKKSALVDVAEDLGLDTGGTKDDLQIRIADARVGQIDGHTYPDSEKDGSTRKPASDLESSFESTEQRREAIMKAADRMVATAWEKRTSYLLLESLLPRDEREPLSIQPGYMQHHPDKIPVVEALVPQLNPKGEEILPLDDRVVATGQEAARLGLTDGESQVVVHSNSEDELSVRPSRRQRDRGSTVILEVMVPHVAFRVHKAEQNPLRLWKTAG